MSDIRENIVLAQRFIGNASEEEFVNDKLKFYAVMRCLEIIAEASRRLDEPFRAKHPTIPWADIFAAGNLYRHQYDDIEENMIWLTVSDDLPVLLAMVEAELG